MLDAVDQRPSPADRDALTVGEHRIEHLGPGFAEHAPLLLVVVRRGDDRNLLEAVGFAQLFFEFDTTGERKTDVDDHRTVCAQLAGNLVDAGPGDAQAVRDLLLRQPGDEVVPGNTRP